MSQKKQKITRIEQPKTQSRAERLHYLAQLRGEIEEEKPQLNKKKSIIISLIILALWASMAGSQLKLAPAPLKTPLPIVTLWG